MADKADVNRGIRGSTGITCTKSPPRTLLSAIVLYPRKAKRSSLRNLGPVPIHQRTTPPFNVATINTLKPIEWILCGVCSSPYFSY
ncbi:hypothetical protein FKM82_001930 [Ascaphus truei]